MSAVELTVLPVSDQCKGLLGIDSMFWWRLRSKCSPDPSFAIQGLPVGARTHTETSLMTTVTVPVRLLELALSQNSEGFQRLTPVPRQLTGR